jgi:putative ABC transport system permease protein
MAAISDFRDWSYYWLCLVFNNPFDMFSMFKVASRFLIKYRAYTAINVIGLSLSLVCVIFIGLYIYDELSFDYQHTRRNRIYRVIEHEKRTDGTNSALADVAFRLGSLNEQFSNVEQSCRITTFGRANFSASGTDRKVHDPFTVTDQGFMDIFDFQVIHGSRTNALREPNTVVITRSTAMKLFGQTNVVDKTISNDRDAQLFRITAVLEDFPKNSHIQANMLFSMASFEHLEWFV